LVCEIIFTFNIEYLSFSFLASSKFCILPLHSQLPCADQRKVFEPVPSGVRKVKIERLKILYFNYIIMTGFMTQVNCYHSKK